MNAPDAVVVPLRDHPEHCEFFAAAFEAEWPAWYGPGGSGNALADLRAFAHRDGDLPVGVVAIGIDGRPLGVAALKARSIDSHAHLSPWAAAGYVVPSARRQGLGALLLQGVAAEAARLGYPTIYCATATAESLLAREGWRSMGTVPHDGHTLHLFCHHVARDIEPNDTPRSPNARNDRLSG